MIAASVADWIEYDEGLVLTPTQGPGGHWNIGYGHNLSANGLPSAIVHAMDPSQDQPLSPEDAIPFLNERGFTVALAESLLGIDIADVRRWLIPVFWSWPAQGSPRQAALVNMGYNLGPVTFGEFTTFIELVNRSSWTAAASDLRGTLVFRQLTVRYSRIADTIESGQWPDLPDSSDAA